MTRETLVRFLEVIASLNYWSCERGTISMILLLTRPSPTHALWRYGLPSNFDWPFQVRQISFCRYLSGRSPRWPFFLLNWTTHDSRDYCTFSWVIVSLHNICGWRASVAASPTTSNSVSWELSVHCLRRAQLSLPSGLSCWPTGLACVSFLELAIVCKLSSDFALMAQFCGRAVTFLRNEVRSIERWSIGLGPLFHRYLSSVVGIVATLTFRPVDGDKCVQWSWGLLTSPICCPSCCRTLVCLGQVPASDELNRVVIETLPLGDRYGNDFPLHCPVFGSTMDALAHLYSRLLRTSGTVVLLYWFMFEMSRVSWLLPLWMRTYWSIYFGYRCCPRYWEGGFIHFCGPWCKRFEAPATYLAWAAKAPRKDPKQESQEVRQQPVPYSATSRLITLRQAFVLLREATSSSLTATLLLISAQAIRSSPALHSFFGNVLGPTFSHSIL